MEVSRHAVSDLLCAELDEGHTKVDSAGLPSAEAIEGIENAEQLDRLREVVTRARAAISAG